MIFKKAFDASTNVQSERFFETIYKNYFLKTWVFELILRDFKEKVLFLFWPKNEEKLNNFSFTHIGLKIRKKCNFWE